MPCAWAMRTTSATVRYLVVRSPRTLIAGCGVFCASTERRLSSWPSEIGWSFQNMLPSWVTASVIGGVFLLSGFSASVACGSSTLTLCDINGAVIMKMMSSTSITSTRGVTLISAIGPPLSLPELKAMVLLRQRDCLALAADCADSRAGGEEVVQVVGEGVELAVGDAVQAHEDVVREHRRNGDEQADRGHDQRLADRAGHGGDRGLARGADADQRAVDAPHGAEQADERRGRTDGGEHGQAVLEARGFAGHALAQGAVDELGAVQRLDQARALVALVVGGGLGGVERDLRERLGLALLFHEADRILRVRGFPEGADHTVGTAAQAHVLEEVDDDPVPGHRRHDHERQCDRPLNGEVTGAVHHLGEEVGDAHLLHGIGGGASGGSSGGGEFLKHDAYL